MGLLSDLCSTRVLERFLHNCDVACFSHTGYDYTAIQGASPSSSMSLLCFCPRLIAANSGGVAVFVRRKVARLFKVELTRQEFGMIWFSYGKRGERRVFFLACYLPPAQSTYYRQEECPDFDEHWAQLQRDIAMFQSKGDVCVTGDLNARVGNLNEWDLLDPIARRASDLPALLGSRKSKDAGINKAGRNLVRTCELTKLCMLNGRARGERSGGWTYGAVETGRGGRDRGRSVIDWWLVPSQWWLDSAATISLDITHPAVSRPDGGVFDHSPVQCTLAWVKDGEQLPEVFEQDTMAQKQYRWREDVRTVYCQILQGEGEILQGMHDIHLPDLPAKQSCDALYTLICRAAEILHDKVGGVVINRVQGEAHSRGRGRVRAWISERTAELQDLVQSMGLDPFADQVQLTSLRTELRRGRKRDRREYLRQQVQKLKDDLPAP